MTRTHRRPLALVLLVLTALLGVPVVHATGPAADGTAVAAGVGPVAAPEATGTTEPTNATIRITTSGGSSTFTPARATVSQDGVLTVVNQTRLFHTVTSEATDSDGTPLFDVDVPAGATVTLPGAGLAAGRYAFYCRPHPNMRGTLVVTGDDDGASGTKATFRQPLVVPRTLRGDHVTLDMRRSSVRMLPSGRRTTAWTYDGTWPGPTIRRTAGDPTLVTVVNHLPRRAGSMSMHLHGDHHASRFDGQPTSFLVRRGRSRTYRYDLSRAGEPEPGSFFWYHDHRMDRTARNNWMGLQGMFIVDDPAQDRIGLPRGARDLPLMISDRSFTKRNQLTGLHEPTMVHDMGHGMGHGTTDHAGMAFTGPHAPPNDASVGTQLLVNGRLRPYVRTAAVRYRLRLLNSSAFSSYNLVLSNGRPFVQIGTGDGLLPHPVTRRSILLGPSQRADVVVDLHGLVGKNVVLESVARTDGSEGTGSRVGPLLQFRVRDRAPDHSRVPHDLPSPRLVRAPATVAKTWTFSLEGDAESGTFWAIDGKAFDPDRVDHRVRLGTREKWVLRNTSDITHYVHLHQEHWRTVSRNGKRPPPWERGLEDTWRLDPGERVVVAARFVGHTGRFMVHCHMLDHEDHGMMATFEVVR
ncbi:MAG TPA: multicopper oxidase domain-containing protein [Nocardioides sp.]|nr:multicopper oxidase domain-containing protein [Nocardioides sp.]